MNDPWTRILKIRLFYLGIVILLLLVQTLPLNTSVNGFAPPDLIMVITFALVLRHPTIASPIVVVMALLLADFILQRPPGLWALVVFAATIAMRTQTADLRESVFLQEWLTAAAATVLCFVVYHFALVFTFLPTQNLRLAAMQCSLTVLMYPIAVSVLGFLIRENDPRSKDTASAKLGR